MQKGRFAIVGIGFALFLATNTFLLLGFSFLPQFGFADSSFSWNGFFEPSYVLAFFLCVLASARSPRVRDSVPFAAAALLCLGGALLLPFSVLFESLPLLCASGVLFGLGEALCFVCWEFAFAMSGYGEAKKQLVFGSALSAIPFLLLCMSEESLLLPLVLLFAACSFVLLFFALRAPAGDNWGAIASAEAPCSLGDLLGSFWKPLLCIFLIGFLWPVLEVAVQGDAPAFAQTFALNLFSNLLAAAAMGLIWLVLGKEVGVESAYLVLFPLLITVFLLLPWIPEDFYPLVLFFLLFAFSLFSIVIMVACIQIAHEKSASLVSAFSLSAGVLYGARLLGQVVAGVLERSSLSRETLVVGCSFFLLYLCSVVMFVLSSKRKPAEGAGEAAAEKDAEGGAAKAGAAVGTGVADGLEVADGADAGVFDVDVAAAPADESAVAATASEAGTVNLAAPQAERAPWLEYGVAAPTSDSAAKPASASAAVSSAPAAASGSGSAAASPAPEAFASAGVIPAAPEATPTPAGVDVLHEECILLAQERGLTPRQTEVLDLLVHGNDVPSIAKKLYISENTVRTHTKKIYLLLDVHSKQEIVDLVDARCAARAGGLSGGVQQVVSSQNGASSGSPSR